MTIEPICIDCARYHPGKGNTLSCDAFPHGIPQKILQGIVDHRKEHYKGDGGLLFKPYKEGDDE